MRSENDLLYILLTEYKKATLSGLNEHYMFAVLNGRPCGFYGLCGLILKLRAYGVISKFECCELSQLLLFGFRNLETSVKSFLEDTSFYFKGYDGEDLRNQRIKFLEELIQLRNKMNK